MKRKLITDYFGEIVMTSKFKTKPIFIIALGIVITFSTFIFIDLNSITGNRDKNSVQEGNLEISAVSGKIHIDNNWTDAMVAGICTGSGTETDPYIIEDLIIDGNDSGSYILIENSDVYFKIENCTLYNSKLAIVEENEGIMLNNVQNGQLINNNCSYNSIGINIISSDSNDVLENIVNDNKQNGINLEDSDNNSLIGNTANNNLWDGISLLGSDYNTISGNEINNNGLAGVSIGEGFWESFHNIVSENSANNNQYGILLTDSYYTTLTKNSANNNQYGIFLIYTDSNIVSQNFANNNQYGISVSYSSDYNTISGNNLIGNNVCIIEIESKENEFYDNGSCTYSGVKEDSIPGYDLFFLLAMLYVTSLILLRSLKNLFKENFGVSGT